MRESLAYVRGRERLLTTDQVAERLEVTPRTVRRYIQEGQFGNVFRVGGQLRVPEGEVERFVARCAVGE